MFPESRPRIRGAFQSRCVHHDLRQNALLPARKESPSPAIAIAESPDSPGGHATVTKFGYFESSQSPGQPEKLITFGTPNASASRIVRCSVPACASEIALIGMQHISSATQGADDQPGILQFRAKVLKFGRLVKPLELNMSGGTIISSCEFDGFDVKRPNPSNDLVQSEIGEQRGEQTQFHVLRSDESRFIRDTSGWSVLRYSTLIRALSSDGRSHMSCST